jgi:hypothetical protein
MPEWAGPRAGHAHESEDEEMRLQRKAILRLERVHDPWIKCHHHSRR